MSALHRFLVEFDLDRPDLARGAWPLLGRAPLPDTEPEPEAEEPMLIAPDDGSLAEAVAAALAEAEDAHASALAAALADLAERHAADLAEARARWAAEEAAVLAGGFRAAMQALEDGLAEAAGGVLEPLVGEALRLSAVVDLRAAVADLVLSGVGGRIVVAGPADLLDALAASLGEAGVDASNLDFTPSEAVEVSVTADTSAIETRLGAWARTLQRRLGDRA